MRAKWCSTDDLVADILTKPLDRKRFVRLRDYMMNIQAAPNEGKGQGAPGRAHAGKGHKGATQPTSAQAGPGLADERSEVGEVALSVGEAAGPETRTQGQSGDENEAGAAVYTFLTARVDNRGLYFGIESALERWFCPSSGRPLGLKVGMRVNPRLGL